MPDKAGCPKGMRDDGTSCWSPIKCSKVTWKNPIPKCSGGKIEKTLMDRQSCKSSEEKYGGLCYPKCRDGYKAVGCCVCDPKGGAGIKKTLTDRQSCPSGMTLALGLCHSTPYPLKTYAKERKISYSTKNGSSVTTGNC
jgi:hypothetical protein